MGAEVGFDIEAHWSPGPIRAYPARICIRAKHAQGEASAEIAWDDVAQSLQPFLPALESEEEFPNVVAWAPPVDETATASPTAPAEGPESSAASAEISAAATSQRAAPMRVQISDAQSHQDAERPSSFRWPPIDHRSGKWRVEVWLLFAAFALTGMLAAVTLRGGSGPAPTPFIHLPTRVPGAVARGKHPRHVPLVSVSRRASHSDKVSNRHVSQNPGVRALGQTPYHAIMPPAALPTVRYHVNAKGAAWEGPVIHVSATNIKVYGLAEHATRSFVVSSSFKSVFSADGAVSYPMSYVQPGAVVRVFYSYVLGFRHPNAIFIIRPPNRTRR